MPIPQELLDILCCPKSKTDVVLLTADQLQRLNTLISKQKITYVNGDPVKKALQEGLITIDGKTVYRIDDNIPIMLIEKGITVPAGFEL